MIDTKELRGAITRHGVRILNEDEVLELLDHLEEAESDALEQARLNGMGASREAALMAKLEAAERERNTLRIELNEIRYGVAVTHDTIKALRAKIEQMERQDPIAWMHPSGGVLRTLGTGLERATHTIPLYLAPGAQPAPSFADAYQGAMEEVAIWKRRALEAEDLNRKFIAEINGPAYMGEPAQPAPSVPVDLITDYLVSISAHVAHQDDHKAQAEIGELLRMLAAAPEAKP